MLTSRKFWLLCWVCLLLGLALIACGGASEATPTEAPAAPTVAESDEAEPAATTEPAATSEAAAPTAAPEAEATEEILTTLPNLDTTLATLSSYRWSMVTHIISETGEALTSIVTITVTTDPPAREVRVNLPEQAGLETGPIAMTMTQVGDTSYMFMGEIGCISTPAGEGDVMDDDFMADIMRPEDILSDLEGARRVRPNETINGIETRHYVFDEQTFAPSDMSFDQVEGHIYLAEEGGYAVRYTLFGTSSAGLGGDDGPREIQMEFNLLDVNQPITIILPEGCDTGAAFPMVEDASEVASFAGLTTYMSALSLEEVVAFYQETLLAEGWEYVEEDSLNQPTFTTLVFEREDVRLTVNLSSDATTGKTTVLLTEDTP